MILLPRPNDYLDWKAWATELIRRLDSNDPVRDVAKALVAGDDITAEYDPQKKTIRLSAGISDEVIDDRVAALLQAGANITLTYNDVGNTLTIAASSGATDLGYTASTRVLTSSTGADVTLPLFSSSEPGLVAASGGGTTNFLRADGSWAAPSGGGGGSLDIRDEGSTIFGGSGFINFVGSGVDADSVSGGVDVKILGDGRQHVKPILSDFSWVNQGGASATQYGYGIGMVAPGGTADNLRLLVRTMPTPPYQVRMRSRWLLRRGAYASYCMCFRDSASGRIVAFNPAGGDPSNDYRTAVNYWNSATSWNSNQLDTGQMLISSGGADWARIRDDGTNFYCDISPNGDDWLNFWSAGRTAWLASPNQIGFGLLPIQPSGTLRDSILSVLSWEQI